MKIHFCDICNESVPQNDLDGGRALMRKGRVICSKCDQIMSAGSASVTITPSDPGTKFERAEQTAMASGDSGAETLEGTEEGGSVRSRGPVQYRSEGGGAMVAGFLSAAAVVLVAVVAVMMVDRIQAVSKSFDQDVAAVQRDVTAAENSLAARIDGLKSASLQSTQNLDARFDALLAGRDQNSKQTTARLDDLSYRLDGVSERLASLAGTERSVGDLGRTLILIEASLAAFRLDLSKLSQDLAARPVVVSQEPLKPEQVGPIWAPLVEDLTNANSGVRWNAVEDLGHTGDRAVVSHLIPVLDDEDTFVRMAAARALGDLGGNQSVEPLIETLSDPAESVRDAAVSSLRQITGQSFRFDSRGKRSDRTKRIRAWRDWWEKQDKV